MATLDQDFLENYGLMSSDEILHEFAAIHAYNSAHNLLGSKEADFETTQFLLLFERASLRETLEKAGNFEIDKWEDDPAKKPIRKHDTYALMEGIENYCKSLGATPEQVTDVFLEAVRKSGMWDEKSDTILAQEFINQAYERLERPENEDVLDTDVQIDKENICPECGGGKNAMSQLCGPCMRYGCYMMSNH